MHGSVVRESFSTLVKLLQSSATLSSHSFQSCEVIVFLFPTWTNAIKLWEPSSSTTVIQHTFSSDTGMLDGGFAGDDPLFARGFTFKWQRDVANMLCASFALAVYTAAHFHLFFWIISIQNLLTIMVFLACFCFSYSYCRKQRHLKLWQMLYWSPGEKMVICMFTRSNVTSAVIMIFKAAGKNKNKYILGKINIRQSNHVTLLIFIIFKYLNIWKS